MDPMDYLCISFSFFSFAGIEKDLFWQLGSFGSLTGIRNLRCPQREKKKKKIEGALQMCHY